ncbi:hypothetical protein [Ruegeria pomeroyi]|nr:hypothetical protein [Ruegeria pomeroyi]
MIRFILYCEDIAAEYAIFDARRIVRHFHPQLLLQTGNPLYDML